MRARRRCRLFFSLALRALGGFRRARLFFFFSLSPSPSPSLGGFSLALSVSPLRCLSLSRSRSRDSPYFFSPCFLGGVFVGVGVRGATPHAARPNLFGGWGGGRGGALLLLGDLRSLLFLPFRRGLSGPRARSSGFALHPRRWGTRFLSPRIHHSAGAMPPLGDRPSRLRRPSRRGHLHGNASVLSALA